MNNNTGWANTMRVLIPILVYAGITYLVEIVGTMIAMTFTVLGSQGSNITMDTNDLVNAGLRVLDTYAFELSMAACILALPVMLYFMNSDRKRLGAAKKEYEPVNPYLFFPLLLMGAAACLALNNMISISGLAGNYQENMNQVRESLYQGRIILELFGIGILSPIVEEMLFRGLVLNRLEEVGSTNHAIFMSAILFGCYHGNLLQMIYASFLGMLMGYVYTRYRTLLAPILVHVGANIVSVIGSETNLLDGMYLSDTMVMIYTGIWCAVVLLCTYVVSKYVEAREVPRG